MEGIAILASIPIAFIASFSYSAFVRFVVSRSARWSYWFRAISQIVLAMILIEGILLWKFGPVVLYGACGEGYFLPHLMLFFLGPPALANLFVLRKRAEKIWFLAAVPCTILAFSLVMLQLEVSDRLFGIDGVNGPFSSSQVATPPPADTPSA